MSKSRGNVVTARRDPRQAGRRRLALVPLHRRRARGRRGASAPRWSTRWCAASCSRCGTRTASSRVYANIDRFDPAAAPVPVAERPLLDRWALGRAEPAGHAPSPPAWRTTTPPAAAAPWRRSSTTSPTGTCAAAGAASGRAPTTATSWPPTRRCTSAWSRVAKLLAPFTPFIAEEMYQNLVAEAGVPGAPESVHLCAWPAGRRSDGRRRRAAQHGGRAARGGDGSRRAQRRRGQDASAAGRSRRLPAGGRSRGAPGAAGRGARRAQREAAAHGRERGRAVRPARQAQPARARAAPRQAAAAGRPRPCSRPTRPRWSAEVRPEGSATLAAGRRRSAAALARRRAHRDGGARRATTSSRTAAGRSPCGPQIDEELRDEGLVRELVHAVQLSRKNADLRIEDTIDLALTLPAGLRAWPSGTPPTSAARRSPARCRWTAAARQHTETARVEGDEVVIGITATGTIFTESYG